MSKRYPDNSAELKRRMASLKAKIEQRKRNIEEGVVHFNLSRLYKIANNSPELTTVSPSFLKFSISNNRDKRI